MTDELEDLFDTSRVITDQDVDNFAAPDLSPEDLAKHVANMVARVLEGTGLIEIKEMKSGVGQIHFLGRVKDQDKKRWSRLKKLCLIAMQKVGEGFIGTQDILKPKPNVPEGSTNPDDYDHKFGHIFSFGSKDLKAAALHVCEAIAGFEPETRARREVMEAPLPGRGAPQSGGQMTGRKGAHPVGAGR